MIKNKPSPLPPGAAEQIFRLFDQGTDNLPLCRSNVAALAEFDLNSEKLPTLEALKNLIKEKLPLLPCLRHFLMEEEDGFRWTPFSPNLDEMVTEKTIDPQALHTEIVSILGSKLPKRAPWKLVFLSGYDAHKFALVWCVRHEVIDGGSRAHIFEILFGDEGQKPLNGHNIRFHAPHKFLIRLPKQCLYLALLAPMSLKKKNGMKLFQRSFSP